MKAGHRKAGHRGSRFTTALAAVALASATSLVALATPTIASGAVAGSTYVVLYHQGASTTDARTMVESAGGTSLVQHWPQRVAARMATCLQTGHSWPPKSRGRLGNGTSVTARQSPLGHVTRTAVKSSASNFKTVSFMQPSAPGTGFQPFLCY